MCGRYYRKSGKQRIAETFHLGKPPDEFVLPPWNSDLAHAKQRRELFVARLSFWSFAQLCEIDKQLDKILALLRFQKQMQQRRRTLMMRPGI